MLWLAVSLALAGAVAVTLSSRDHEGGLGATGRGSTADQPADLLAGAPPAGSDQRSAPSLQGLPGAAPRAKDGPVTVTVVDLADAPVADALVVASWTTPPTLEGEQPTAHEQRTTSDALGRATFAHLAYDGSVRMAVHVRGPPSDPLTSRAVIQGIVHLRLVASEGGVEQGRVSAGTRARLARGAPVDLDDVGAGLHDAGVSEETVWAQAHVTGPELRLRGDRGLPLTVHVREGGDGRLVADAPWHALPRLPWQEPTSGSARVPVRRGAHATVTVLAEATRGTVAGPPATFTAFLHPAAKRLEAVVPLRPEARIALAFPPEVQPFRPEDWQGSVQVAGVTAGPERCRVDAQGRLAVEGLPHLRGERVTVTGSIGERWTLTGDAPLGADDRELVAVPLVATARGEPGGQFMFFGSSNVEVLGILGVSSPGLRLGVNMADFRSLRLAFVGMTDATPLPPGSLKVTVLTPTGLPAAGAVVRGGGHEVHCDGAGLARLDGLEAGEVEVRVLGYGAGARERVTVASGRESPVTLNCLRGGTLAVEVVDDEGRGLPYATLAIAQPDSAPWIDFEGEAQRLDPFTDAEGRRTLAGVALGAVKVSASFGSRAAEAEVVVTEGSVQTLRLVLPSVPAPAAAAPTPTEGGSPPR